MILISCLLWKQINLNKALSLIPRFKCPNYKIIPLALVFLERYVHILATNNRFIHCPVHDDLRHISWAGTFSLSLPTSISSKKFMETSGISSANRHRSLAYYKWFDKIVNSNEKDSPNKNSWTIYVCFINLFWIVS